VPSDLALEGGTPVRSKILPYGRQWISDEDVEAVVATLRGDWLTTGPAVGAFEEALCGVTGAAGAVAVNSGTAALHAAMFALQIGPGDEVIVPAMTFAASSNCVLYQGGTPVFVDVDPSTLLIDPAQVEARITPRTKAVVAVDYAGQPADYGALRTLADRHGFAIVADAAHSLGGAYRETPVGSVADLSTFSFHPVKHVTSGEGGAITTNDPALEGRMRMFRTHGITSDARQREATGSWFYEMVELGYNYRITDFQCALATSQLRRLGPWVARRQALAARYDEALRAFPWISGLGRLPGACHAYHLYVARLDTDRLSVDRARVFAALRAEGIGVNVHYIPVHLHPYYQERLGTRPGDHPHAEAAYEQILSLPLFPLMEDGDVDDVVRALEKVGRAYAA
jgi:perosamine synthetase